MLTKNGPKVIEYNCRSETQRRKRVTAARNGLLEIMLAVEEGRLGEVPCAFAAALPAAGCWLRTDTPASINGFEISLGERSAADNVFVYHAGTKLEQGRFVPPAGVCWALTAIGCDAARRGMLRMQWQSASILSARFIAGYRRRASP
jgi:phosphoribosylamine--glycine ligase